MPASSSTRARGAPMQTWIPPPKPMCCAAFSRAASNSSGRSNTRGSRFAEPKSMATFAPRGIAVRRLRVLERDVELVHLHHPVRPVEEIAMPIERHAEQTADDGDRVRLGEVVQELHLARLGERLEQPGRELVGRLAERLDAP